MTDQHDCLGLSADEVLTTTRAVRRRLDLTRPVPRRLIEDCVRIATQAPSGRNSQRWDLVVVDDHRTIEQLAAIWLAGLAEPAVPGLDEGLTPITTRPRTSAGEWPRIRDSLGHLARHIHQVPALVVPVIRVDTRQELAGVRGQAGAWGSVLPAFWSFMLAARERGLGTVWTTAHLSYERAAADLLGIPYETAVQAALSPLAYTLGTSFRPAARQHHSEFTHWNAW